MLCFLTEKSSYSLKHHFNSVAQSCLILCSPTDCSTSGFPVHHQFLKLAQIHFHQVSDAIQPSCPLRFQNFLQTWLWEDFLLCGNFSSFTSPSPGRISIPKSSVSAFVFYILSYLLLKRLSCFSQCLVSFTSFQKLFFGSCSKCKWSFNEFVVEKVVSPSYTSSILEESQHTFHLVCFPGGSDSKESAWNAGELGSISGLRRSPGGGHGNPLQYYCLENLQGQKNLGGL